MEMDSVREWEMQFKEKYQLVGRLLKPGEQHASYSDEDEDTTTENSTTASAPAPASPKPSKTTTSGSGTEDIVGDGKNEEEKKKE
jgi:membrane-associated progesterone receptor component